jgi:uncharacterized RDD family membrane protein YckC
MSLDPDKLDLLKITGFGRSEKRLKKHYATFNRRMLAASIDSFLLMFFVPLVDRLTPVNTAVLDKSSLSELGDPVAMRQSLFAAFTNREFVLSWLSNLGAQVMLICVFSAICWHFWSATPGKMLMRIKIVDAQTEKPMSDTQIVLRLLGYCMSTLTLCGGFLWIGIDKRRQALHDKIADTVVVTLPWRKQADIAE